MNDFFNKILRKARGVIYELRNPLPESLSKIPTSDMPSIPFTLTRENSKADLSNLSKLNETNINSEAMIPEHILKKRLDYEWKQRNLIDTGEALRKYVNTVRLPVKHQYDNVVFAHGMAAFFDNKKMPIEESLNRNFENISKGKNDPHLSISVSRPGEEVGGYGVYVKGDIHFIGDQDYGSSIAGQHGAAFYSKADYDKLKASRTEGDNIIYKIKENDLNPMLLDRTISKGTYNTFEGNFDNPKDFFNMKQPGGYYSYTESIMTHPEIQGVWINDFIIGKRSKDRELIERMALDNNLPIFHFDTPSGSSLGNRNTVNRIIGDRFNPDFYNYPKYFGIDINTHKEGSFKYELDKIFDEALYLNNNYDMRGFDLDISNDYDLILHDAIIKESEKYNHASNRVRGELHSIPDDKFSTLMTNRGLSWRGVNRYNSYWDYIELNESTEARITNDIFDIDKNNYKRYIDKVDQTEGKSFIEKEYNFLHNIDNLTSKEKYDFNDIISFRNNRIKKDYNDFIKEAKLISNDYGSYNFLNRDHVKELEKKSSMPMDLQLLASKNKAKENPYYQNEGDIWNSSESSKKLIEAKREKYLKKVKDIIQNRNNNININRKEIAQKAISRGKEKRRQKLGEEANNVDKIARKHGTTLSNLERAGNIEIGPDGTITFQLNEEIAASKDKSQNKEKKPNPNKGKNREKQRQLNEERKKKEQERKQKQKESKNKNKSKNTNNNQNKQKRKTNILKNEDGSMFKHIDLGNDTSIGMHYDANGKMTGKQYIKNNNGYFINYDRDGNIIEGFRQGKEGWSNIVHYDKDLNPTDITTYSNFNLDEAKELKNEADKAWQDLGLDGINDVLPNINYNKPKPDKPEPEPEQPQPDNNTDDSSEDTNSENTDNNNTDDSNNTDTNTDDSSDNTDNTDDSSDEDNNNNTNTNSDNENNNDEGSNDDSNNTNTEQNNSDDENNNNNTNTNENTDNTNTNTNDDGNNNNADQNNTSEPEQEPEPEPEPPSPDEEPLTDEENSYLKDRANKLKDLYKEKLKELNDLKEEIKNKKEAIKQSKKNGADETLIQKLKDELQDLLKRKKLKQKEVRKAKTKYNNRNTENGLWGDISDINDELSGLDDFVNTTNQSHPDLDKQIKDAINKKEKPEVIKALQELSDKLKNAKDRITNLNMKKSALRKFFTKKYGGKKLKNLSEPQKLKGFGLNELFTLYNTVSTYKDQRREGHGVISSSAKAGTELLLSESLGFGQYMALSLIRELPTATVKGSSAIFKETRRMNSAARFQIFGDADFQDTQQLATMRQSGMELAKMSQYRLEQTLMGNEARYLHK